MARIVSIAIGEVHMDVSIMILLDGVYANIKLQGKIKKFLIFLGNGKIKYTFLLKKRVHDLLLCHGQDSVDRYRRGAHGCFDHDIAGWIGYSPIPLTAYGRYPSSP